MDEAYTDLRKMGIKEWRNRARMKLSQDRDRWQALVGTVRDFRVP
jgi:hypothetical protein